MSVTIALGGNIITGFSLLIDGKERYYLLKDFMKETDETLDIMLNILESMDDEEMKPRQQEAPP